MSQSAAPQDNTSKKQQNAARNVTPPKPATDDDVVGKVYDRHLMGRLVKYLRPYKLQVALSATAILIKASADVAGPYLVKVAVDRYMHVDPADKPSWLARHLSPVATTGISEIAGLYFGALVLSFLLEFVQTYLMQWTGQKIMFDLRKQIFRHIQLQDVGFFDKNPVGRLVTRVTSDVDALNEMFTSGVLAIFEDVFVLLFIVAIMLGMNWPLALLTLSVIPAILYATSVFRRHVRDSYRRQRAATAQINSFTQEYVSGMSIVQLFNRERRAYADFQEVNARNKDAWTDAIKAYSLYYPIVEFLSSFAIALVLWRGGFSILRAVGVPAGSLPGGVVTVGILVAFIQYAQRFFRPIQDLSDKYNILQAAMAAAERVFKLLDTQPSIVSPQPALAVDADSPELGRIEFRDVWFTYEDLTGRSPDDPSIEWILRGISFTIEPNQTAAIVGHTGAGKTTITGLMMRFYDIQRGQILVDGLDIRQQDVQALRRRFGVVLQDPFLFTGTIADNIRMGTPGISERRMERAAEEVNVLDFIESLPAGFQEPVRERGAGLSTGQKQLVSFARALAHDPGILILDEATSSVDTETEHRVRQALARMITGRTSVLIAHRLSTIQSADTILVMHKGQLREQGTHQQLLAKHGLYFKLYELQYKDQDDSGRQPAASLPVQNEPVLSPNA